MFKSALAYLARRPRSVLEMRRYLSGKKADPEIIDDIIKRLLELNYLDDRSYARQFIDNRVRFKPKSVYALGYELTGKGIDSAIAGPLLQELDDFELAFSAAQRKYFLLRHLANAPLKIKIMNHLKYRGFDHNVSVSVWKKLMES